MWIHLGDHEVHGCRIWSMKNLEQPLLGFGVAQVTYRAYNPTHFSGIPVSHGADC